MARFTDEQARFGKAMELMIDLYHQLKVLHPKLIKVGSLSAAWYSEPLILKMAEIFHLTIPNFSPCLYFVENSIFRYRGEGETIIITRGGLTNFVEAMDSLKDDISTNVRVCFKIREIITVSHAQAQNASRLKWKVMKRSKSKKPHMVKCTIVSPIKKKAASTGEMSAYLEKRQMALNTVPATMDSFVLDGCDSRLGDVVRENYKILYAAHDYGSDSGRYVCPGFSEKESSFFDVIAYLLIRYEWLFESFERAKVCKQCGKLFFEKRLGAREFCGGTCRKRYHDSLQAPEKRECRNRQNQWIGYQHNNVLGCPEVFRLQKDDCNQCTGTTPSGKCPALIKKNPKAYKFLNKLGE